MALYVIAEGSPGASLRATAWETHHGTESGVIWHPAAISIFDPLWASALAEVVGELQPALVVIDSVLILRSITLYPGMCIAVLWFAAIGAIPIHFLMVRALVRAERNRAAADEAARQLELRVYELQRANAERARLAFAA